MLRHFSETCLVALAFLALVTGGNVGAEQQSKAGSGQASETTHIPAAEMKAAFAEGRPVLKADKYQVHASRRQEPGIAELHRRDTDVFHILEGTATIVLGGEIVEPRELDAFEVRGSAIRGGREQKLAAGDVLVIPPGVPHWFRDIAPPFRYFTVKVTD